MAGHGKVAHAEGFGSPVGAIKGWEKALEDCTIHDLADREMLVGHTVLIPFESGITVRGKLVAHAFRGGKLCLLSFSECTVEDAMSGEHYFKPEWGRYDMAVGAEIISVFSGAADKMAFESTVAISTHKTTISVANADAHQEMQLYAKIRAIREIGKPTDLACFLHENDQALAKSWLALIELLEMAIDYGQPDAAFFIEERLRILSDANTAWQKNISDGIRLAKDMKIRLIL